VESLHPAKITVQYICNGDNSLRATTFGGRSLAESTIKFFEQFEVNPGYLRTKVNEILGSLRTAAGSRSPGGEKGREMDRIRSLGQDLYRELVPASFRAKLFDTAGGDLLLAMDSSLTWIPWELLHDGTEFLCRQFNMGRIVSVPGNGERVRKTTLALPVRHFAVADPEGNLPAAAAEGRETLDLLLCFGDRALPTLLSGRVGETGFIDGLRRADVFHFAGHLDGEGDEARILLSGGACTAAQVRKLSGRFSFPALVFMNGCRSSTVDELRLESGQSRAFGLASTFLFCGVRHYIGTLWDVRDSAAAAAGSAFFRSFYSGRSVGAAVKEARIALAREFGEASMVWSGFVLYGDPSFTIPGVNE
jgi:CHAT domain-containing protein